MRNTFKTLLLALPLCLAALSAQAADGAAGRWKTIDDKIGKVKSIVEISQAANGTLTGKVVDILHSDKGPNPVCDGCDGANRNKPVKGMTILWNLKADGANKWSGGTILDPANGTWDALPPAPSGHSGLEGAIGSVGDRTLVRGQLLQPGAVLLGVVVAEQQFATRGQDCANPRGRAATIATVGGGECSWTGKSVGHCRPPIVGHRMRWRYVTHRSRPSCPFTGTAVVLSFRSNRADRHRHPVSADY